MAATASKMNEAGSDADALTEPRAVRLRQLAGLFLKLGTIAFGGPAAHIAMMEDEVVRRRKWMTREQFLDLLGATNLIPGPNSTEMAIHIGYLRAGWSGLLVAGQRRCAHRGPRPPRRRASPVAPDQLGLAGPGRRRGRHRMLIPARSGRSLRLRAAVGRTGRAGSATPASPC